MKNQNTETLCTVKIAVCPHLGFKKNGEPIFPSIGQKLKVMPLKEAVYSQLKINESKPKGASGCIFPFEYDIMYSVHDIDFYNSGVVFVDLDHISSSTIEFIIQNFNKLCQYLPDLVCLHLSYSGSGLHLYFLSPELEKLEYEKRVLINCLRLEKTLKVLNINLPKSAFDSHQVSIKQRFFLNRPKDNKIYWNDLACPSKFSPIQENTILEKEMPTYKSANNALYRKWLSTKPVKSTSFVDNTDYTNTALSPKSNIAEHLGHQDRMLLFNSLRVVFNDNKDTVLAEWSKCMNRMEFTTEHSTQLKDALTEPQRNNWFNYDTPHVSRYLLSRFYDINEIKEVKPTDDEYPSMELNDDDKALIEKYL